MILILVCVFLILLILGVPIAASMGLGSFVAVASQMPNALLMIPSKIFGGLDSFSLMAIPFFILAGALMDGCGISKALVDFSGLLIGWARGGLSMVVVVSSVVFAAITGSAAAATSAIGAILIASLTAKGYEKGFSASLVASGGMIGPIIPPSLTAVVYASATGVSVGALFMAGVFPGLLMGAALIINCILYARSHPEVAVREPKKTSAQRRKIIFDAIPAVMMPVIIIGGIVSGIFTPTESAAIACGYAIIYGVMTGKLKWDKLVNIFWDGIVSTSKLMFIIGCATLFGWILSIKQFPAAVASFIVGITSSKWVAIALIIGILLIVGCFMENIAALNILVPILYPIGVAYGFNDIHFAMIVIMVLLYGSITPPVGILLYISSGIAEIRFAEAVKYIWPFLISLFLVCIAVTLFPALTVWLPSVLGYVT